MKYNNHLNYKKRKRFLLKVKLALALLFLVVAVGGWLFYQKYIQEDNPNTVDTTTSAPSITTIASSIAVYRSPYFQFQARDSWVEISDESTPNKFVYRSLRSNIIEHEIVIYINQIPGDLEANRTYPVVFKNSNTEMTPLEVSDHCVKANNGKSTVNVLILEVDTVQLRCDSDSTNYTVLAGQKDDDTVLNMIRPDGTLIAYAIYYKNLKANPEPSELKGILASFQTR